MARSRRISFQIVAGAVLVVLIFSVPGAVSADAGGDDRAKVRLAVENIVAAYESRRPENVLRLVSSDFSHPLKFEQALLDDFDSYHSSEVLLRVGPVVTGKDSASARVMWYRKRIDRKTGRQEKTEGEATLYFRLEEGDYKLVRQEGQGFLPASRK